MKNRPIKLDEFDFGKKYKILAFDIDNTLGKSRQKITPPNAKFLKELLVNHKVLIVTGGHINLIQSQVLSCFDKREQELFKNLFLFSDAGGTGSYFYNREWRNFYEVKIPPKKKEEIYQALKKMSKMHQELIPKQVFGSVVDDRGTSIAVSMLGQEAPLELKQMWDKDQEKRIILSKTLNKLLNNKYSIKVGGTTTLDITLPGVDKAYAIEYFLKKYNYFGRDILYVGDALFPGGNDAAVLKLGIDALWVKDEFETEKFLEKYLSLEIKPEFELIFSHINLIVKKILSVFFSLVARILRIFKFKQKQATSRVARKKEEKVKNEYFEFLKRHRNNPILAPQTHVPWENNAVFNTAAVLIDDKVHLMYRAMGDGDISVLGHVCSEDGENVNHAERFLYYKHDLVKKKHDKGKVVPKIQYLSGGGENGGCEDPRLVRLEDNIYLTYTMFNGWDSVRMAYSAISVEDFVSKKDTWSKPVFMSPPGQLHKNWLIFPERINGKIAILHSISPTIMVDYIDDFDHFNDDNFVYSIHQTSPLWAKRDKYIKGAGPPPIKTDSGWLILYHGFTPNEMHKYKLFGMLLDLNDPTKILYKSKYPILEPKGEYEMAGIKPGIVYVCGAVVKGQEIYVYYGGADNFVCLATANLNELLEHIKQNSTKVVLQQKHFASLPEK